MKKIISKFSLIIVLSIVYCQLSHAQTSEGIPYQAVARDNGGNLIANQSISLRFTLLQGSPGGTNVYQETHTATTNTFGLFNVNVLKGTTTGPFNPLHWEQLIAFGVYMKVEIDVTGGSTYTDMGTTQLLSVPFAFYAKISGSTPGAVNYKGTWNASSNSPTLSAAGGSNGDYYVVSVAGNTPLNGISDWEVSDWVIYNGTAWAKVDNSDAPVSADNVSFTPTPDLSSTNVQDAIVEVNGQFANLIDSYIHRTDDNVTIYQPYVAAPKRFGIGDTTPDSPLGIKGETGQDDQMITFKSVDNSQKWNINLNPTGNDVDGFSIDDISSGISSSRFFIDKVSQGNVGIGTVTPNQKLHVTGANDGGNVSIMVENLESGTNSGWLMSAVDDNVIPERVKTFAIHEKTGFSLAERMTVLSGGNVGINETLPYSKLHVSRNVLDPQSEINLAENTGILLLGPIDNKNLGMDSHQIQARTGSHTSTGLSFTATTLGLQPYGGGIIIHNSYASDNQVAVSDEGKVGIGVQDGDASLAVKAPATGAGYPLVVHAHGTGGNFKYGLKINDDPLLSDVGFGINEISSSGAVNRLFINTPTGNVSVGAFIDDRYLIGLKDYDPSGSTSLGITNIAAATANLGWSIGHISDNTLSERNGALSVFEALTLVGTTLERMTFLPGGNVGINEPAPDTKFHASRPVLDPHTGLDLLPGTGIVVIGPMTNNVVFDYQGMQARTGVYSGTSINLTAAELNLQRMGGDILIHGDNTMSVTSKVIIKEGGKLGIGTITPLEKIDIDGAIKIGTTSNTNDGTVRYTGTDFEGRKDGAWVSLTTGNDPWSIGLSNTIYYNTGTIPRVGIGTATATAALHVEDNSSTATGSAGAIFKNKSSNTGGGQDDHRIGIQVECSNIWGGNPLSKNVGLYVKEVTGQPNKERNLAAVMNGNVLIGDIISTTTTIGANGRRVLGIQTGDMPTQAMSGTGPSNGGIQIYSNDLSIGPGSPPVSVLNVMTGDGHVIQLYRSSAITAPDNSFVGSSYTSVEAGIIDNLRTRINELEAILKAYGLLPP